MSVEVSSPADELLDELFADPDALLAPYRTPDGIVRFAREILHVDLAPYQEDILRNFVIHKRASARGPHGLGKTTLAAIVVLWGISVFPDDVKIPTTASAWRQLDKFLWPEIHKWARNADWSKLGIQMRDDRELLDLAIKLRGKEAFAIASDNPALIEGAHAKILIYIFDEAKAIPAGTWDAAEGAFSTAGEGTESVAYALAISTPGETSGRFYDTHKRRSGYEDWWTRHVTLEEAIAAGRVSHDWADQRKKQWGESAPVYKNRVLGEFAEEGTDTLIPLVWVEAANERYLACQGKGVGSQQLGVDVAWTGNDQSALALRTGSVVEPLEYLSKLDPMEVAGKSITKAKHNQALPILVDVIGIGAGVVSRLREQGYHVIGVNVGEAARDPRDNDLTDSSGELLFLNLRSYGWWMLRERLDPAGSDPIAISPADDRLTGDLTAPKWKTTSSGRVQVESKDEIRKRIGRSTDGADAVMLSLLPPELLVAPKGFVFA